MGRKAECMWVTECVNATAPRTRRGCALRDALSREDSVTCRIYSSGNGNTARSRLV